MGIPVYLLFSTFPWPVILLSVVALGFLAVHVSGAAERMFGEKDPSAVVIDEIVGLQVALFLVTLSRSRRRRFRPLPVFRRGEAFPRPPLGAPSGGYGIVGDDLRRVFTETCRSICSSI